MKLLILPHSLMTLRIMYSVINFTGVAAADDCNMTKGDYSFAMLQKCKLSAGGLLNLFYADVFRSLAFQELLDSQSMSNEARIMSNTSYVPPVKDRIRGLHDSLVCRILSFLPMKETVRMSVLSMWWRYLWTSILKLDFDCSSLGKSMVS
ncbi:hypothetical protein Drorol1_Dr00014904 [Drosera rotundifolia]